VKTPTIRTRIPRRHNLPRVDQVFAPPGETWQRVSPRLAELRRGLLVLWTLVLAAIAGVVGWALVGWWGAAGAIGLGAVALAWGFWLIDRNWRAWGYAEREDDLLVTHGVLFRELTVVPYGRMQFVDVKSGPLERRFGLATVQLHTASPKTDARIPGLPPDEAARLRDRLAALGEARAAGL
jgi:membrane protein YdbS with pleckstrin-like domain